MSHLLRSNFKVFVWRSIRSDCHEIYKLLCQYFCCFQSYGQQPIEDSFNRCHQLFSSYFWYPFVYCCDMHRCLLHSGICALFFKCIDRPRTNHGNKWIRCHNRVWNLPVHPCRLSLVDHSMLFDRINLSQIERNQC